MFKKQVLSINCNIKIEVLKFHIMCYNTNSQSVFIYTAGFVQVMENLDFKSWNLIISLSRPGKSWNLGLGHGKSWKISTLSMSERQ